MFQILTEDAELKIRFIVLFYPKCMTTHNASIEDYLNYPNLKLKMQGSKIEDVRGP